MKRTIGIVALVVAAWIGFVVVLHFVDPPSRAPADYAAVSAAGDSAVPVVGFLAIVGSYFIPVIVAAVRSVKAQGGIAALNVFLGWTVIGWVVALIWAASGETVEEARAKVIDYEKLAAATVRAQDQQRPV